MTAPSVVMARPQATEIDGIKVRTQGGLVRLDVYVAGELVAYPCVGGAITLLAAHLEGRLAIGAERDPATHQKAIERLDKAIDTIKSEVKHARVWCCKDRLLEFNDGQRLG